MTFILFFVQCIIKQLLDSVFVTTRIIKVSVKVITLSLRLWLITLTWTLIILEITKASSNNCLLSAVVSAHFVSQGLPAIAAQGSSLVTCVAHFQGCMWFSSTLVSISSYWVFAVDFFIQYSSSISGSTNKRANRYMSSSLVVPSFVPVLSTASLFSIALCSSVVYSLPTTINSALASRPIVSPIVVPSLRALPLQQPFMVGPSYSPVPFKVVSQITVGKFANLEDL